MAKRQLQLLGFVDETQDATITDFGRQAVELGCDPREAAMLLKAAELGCLGEMALVIAARQGHRFFYRPKGEEWEADQAHSAFQTSEVCDAWALVRAVASAEKRANESLGEWCRQHYVSYMALKDIWLVSKQLLSAMEKLGYTANDCPATDKVLAQAILAGLPDRVFVWKGRGDWFWNEETGQEACLSQSSSIRERVSEMQLAVWEILQLPNISLITNAIVVQNTTG
jgi:HrpA-like RNA helicase